MQQEEVVPISEHGSEEKKISSASHGDISAHQGSQSHAHHLKWGDIAVSGFTPPTLDGEEDFDVDDPCDHTSDRELRR